MSKPPTRRRKNSPNESSEITALIEEARKSQAIILDLSGKGLTKLPESIGQLRALERHNNKEARVVPVIVRDVNWSRAPFAGLQALPKGGLAVTKWPDKDSALRNVSEGIERVVEEIRSTIRR